VDLDDTKGLKTLKECIARSGASSPQFARMMGVNRSTMSLWLSGKRAVSPLAIRAALFCAAMSGVPMRMPKPSRYMSGG
jgi:transcriptional regulator with XRE-family HTH domain